MSNNGNPKSKDSADKDHKDETIDLPPVRAEELPEVLSPPSGNSSRSRSRSKEKKTRRHEKKDKSKMNEEELREEKERERERKKLKKKNRKKYKRPYEELISDPQVINNIRKAIAEDTRVPEVLKEQFTKIELNPIALCLSNLPLNIISQELKHFLNVFLTDLYPKYQAGGKDPVRRVELSETKKYCVLYMQDKEMAEELFNIGSLDYQNSKLKVGPSQPDRKTKRVLLPALQVHGRRRALRPATLPRRTQALHGKPAHLPH